MWWHGAATLALASVGSFGSVSAQIITVTEYPSTCSAVYTSGSQTVTVIQSTTTVEPTPLSDASANNGTPFVIAVNVATSSKKRQATTAWIAGNGNTTTDGTQAAVFTLTNGSLSTTSGVVSASEGVNYKLFAGAAAVGNISLTFSIVNGALHWNNSAFDAGSATFYKTPADLIEDAEIIARFAGAIAADWASVLLTAESESSALSVSSANATQATSVATNIIVSSTSITAGASGTSSGMAGLTTTNSKGATIVTGMGGTSTFSSGSSPGVVMSMPPSSYGTSVVPVGAISSSSSSPLPTISTPGQPIGPSQVSIVANVSSSATTVLSTSGSVTYTLTPTTGVSSSTSASPSLSVSGGVTYTLSSSSTTRTGSTSSSTTIGAASISSLTVVSGSSSWPSGSTPTHSSSGSSSSSGTALLTSSTTSPSSSRSTTASPSASSTSGVSSTRNTSSTASTTRAIASTTTLVVYSTSTTTLSIEVTSTRSTSTTSSYLILPSPTACSFGDPSTTDQDDSFCTIPLPFIINLYTATDTHLYASTNGYLSLLNGSQQYQITKFPDSHIPANTVAPLFEDLYLYANATPAQGIFYQFDSSGVNGTFEYYIGSAAGGYSAPAYHFAVSYSTANAGKFNITYYNVPDRGANAAVGIQGVNSAGTEVAYTYSYRGAKIIAANLTLTCDTTTGSGSCVAS